MANDLQYEIEEMVDKYGLDVVIEALVETCNLKAEHIECNWQDSISASVWKRYGKTLDIALSRIKM